MELKERKPLSDVGQNIQPSIEDIVESDEKDNSKDEPSDSSCVYSPMSVDHDKSISSLTAHRLSCDIDTYTCELYSYLRSVEVLKNYKILFQLWNIIIFF